MKKIVILLSILLVSNLFSKEVVDKYSNYPSQNKLNLNLNTPILLNPKADIYHKAFYTNLNKALIYIKKNKKLVYSDDERKFLNGYNIYFKTIELKNGLLTGNDKDIAAQNFKFDMQMLSDALALLEPDTLDISFVIRDVVKKGIILEGYKSIYEKGKFSFSEFYKITLDDYDVNSFSDALNLVRFIILNPMKRYTNKDINPSPIEPKIENYSKDVVKYISYINKPQKVKIYQSEISLDQYKLAAYFKLIDTKKIEYNGDAKVIVPKKQASNYCAIFDMKPIVLKVEDKGVVFNCEAIRQKNINYIPKYALNDDTNLVKFKDMIVSKNDKLVQNKKTYKYEVWDLELGVKVYEFDKIYELAKYNLPKNVHTILVDKRFAAIEFKNYSGNEYFVYENQNKTLKIVDVESLKVFTDIEYKTTLDSAIFIDDDIVKMKLNESVYDLFDKYNFNHKEHIAKYVKDVWIDTKTNLMWQNSDPLPALGWNEAKKYCEDTKVGFLNDWRMPTVDEVETLRVRRGYDHKQSGSNRSYINPKLGNSSKVAWQNYWSSTKNDIDKNKAMSSNFNYPNNKMWYSLDKKHYIRCVREFK